MGTLEEASREELIDEIRGLRRENASWRTKHRDFADAFSHFDEATTAGLLKLVDNLATNPREAAELMRGVAYDIFTDLGEDIHKDAPWAEGESEPKEEQEENVEDMDEETKQLIADMKAQIEELKGRSDADAQARQEAEEAEIRAVIDEAKALGYEEGSAAMAHLFFAAHHHTNGDLKEAAKMVAPVTGIPYKGEEGEGTEPAGGEGGTGGEGTETEGGEDEGGRRFPSTARANAGTPKPEAAEAPQSIEEAGEALYAFLDSLPD